MTPTTPPAVSGAPEALNHSCANHHREIRFLALPCPICERRTPDFQRQWPRYVCAIPNCPICAMYAEPKQLAAPVSPLRDAEGATAEKQLEELRMGHARLDECSDAAETQGKPLYDRISAKIQKLSAAKDEYRCLLQGMTAERDSWKLRCEAAEHRENASGYHEMAQSNTESEQLATARAALFRLTSFPHACDSYFGEGADECVPCIAQRALDEAQK